MSSAMQRMLAVVVTALIVLMFTPGAQGQGRWVRLAPFPEPNEELYGVAAGGKMYVIGALGGPSKAVVEEYDPAADKWSKKKAMPLAVHHQAMAEYRGKIYVFGGYVPYAPPGMQGGGGGWQPTDNAWEFDPVADTWKTLAPMPGGKRGSAIASEAGGKIYVIGGAVPEEGDTAVFGSRVAHSVGTNEAYDPATNTWETRRPMPTPRNHASAGTVNGKIYVIGGRLGHAFISVATNTNIVEEYDPATDKWGATKAPMPTPRSGGGWGVYKGRIYVGGGEFQTPQMAGTFRALEAYDPAANQWSILPQMPLPRHGVAGAVIGNRLHLVSGRIQSGGIGGSDTQTSVAEHDAFEFTD